NVKTNIPVVGDAKEALRGLLETDIEKTDCAEWYRRVMDNKDSSPFWFERSDDLISPQWLIEELYRETDGQAIITTDVGQHQMWAAQFYQFNERHKWVTSVVWGRWGSACRQPSEPSSGVRRRQWYR